MLLGLALGAALMVLVTLTGTAQRAEAAFSDKIAFASNRTTGTGVDNSTGDSEIFKMKPDGTGVERLTHNTATDTNPSWSDDGGTLVFRRSIGAGDPTPPARAVGASKRQRLLLHGILTPIDARC